MDVFLLKIAIYVVGSIIIIPICLISLIANGDQSDVWGWIHEHKLEGVFDAASFGFISSISALKFNGIELEGSGAILSIIVYFGLIQSIVWFYFRIKQAIDDAKLRKIDIALKEQQLRHNSEEKKRNEEMVKNLLKNKS